MDQKTLIIVVVAVVVIIFLMNRRCEETEYYQTGAGNKKEEKKAAVSPPSNTNDPKCRDEILITHAGNNVYLDYCEGLKKQNLCNDSVYKHDAQIHCRKTCNWCHLALPPPPPSPSRPYTSYKK